MLFCSSCSDSESTFENKTTLVLKDRIIIPIDNETRRDTKKIGFNEELNSIYLFNEENYQLYFFSLDSLTVWKKVQMHKEGPDGLGEVTKIKVHNLDSIFVVNRINYNFYLVGNQGRIVNKIKILSKDDEDPLIQLLSPSLDFITDENELLIPVVPIERTSKDKSASLLSVNIKTSKKKYIGDWPEDFRRWGRKGTTSYGAYNETKNEYVFSHSFSDQIKVWNITRNEFKSFYAGSSRVEEPSYYRGNGSLESTIAHQISNSWFGNIYYDKHNNVYLRGASVGWKVSDQRNPTKISETVNNDKIASVVIILDENFQKIGEVPQVHIKDVIFSTRNGIYLINTSYDQKNEDILVFDRYQLEVNDNASKKN